ncbi:hypothetical protein XENOCAPTIV_026080 [Xenoophorus captivus]|uniref:Uncharacterized protein n=1 Tax=Xenoophorus captivus TaxID=1517983 RepID=A0ABV0QEL0_9TELE
MPCSGELQLLPALLMPRSRLKYLLNSPADNHINAPDDMRPKHDSKTHDNSITWCCLFQAEAAEVDPGLSSTLRARKPSTSTRMLS